MRQARLRHKEVFVPLAHPPGDAQADFGEALVVIGGVEQKAHFQCMDLPQSDDCFVMAFPAENTEAFLEGHNQAFAYFGGVPRTILYDNTKIAVKEILAMASGSRPRHSASCRSHYLFAAKFGRPGKRQRQGKRGRVGGLCAAQLHGAGAAGGELGGVERAFAGSSAGKRRERESCGGIRRPSPSGSSGTGRSCCRCRRRPYEACEKRTTRASSQALVRYETNDYSVPVAYGHRQVLVKAFVWEVVISCASEVIARHARSYEREEMIFDPLHYLALLEQKTNALDQAAPLDGWQVAGGVRGTAAADGRRG